MTDAVPHTRPLIGLLTQYTIIVVAAILAVRGLVILVPLLWPELLTIRPAAGGTIFLGGDLVEWVAWWPINIALVFLLRRELHREAMASVPVLILTFFAGTLGVLFFCLQVADTRLNARTG